MSEGFGHGDGMNDLGNTFGLSESKVSDARRAAPHTQDTSDWPGPRRLILAIVIAVAVVVGGGWLLTLLNAPR